MRFYFQEEAVYACCLMTAVRLDAAFLVKAHSFPMQFIFSLEMNRKKEAVVRSRLIQFFLGFFKNTSVVDIAKECNFT